MSVLRFAGKIPKAIFGQMKPTEIAYRLAPDVFFGGVTAAMTPGDIGDKAIAGAGQALGGGLGGIGMSRLGNKIGVGPSNPLNYLMDMGGSFGGDYAGMFGADQLLKGKDLVSGGSGQTPWEKMGDDQRQQMRQELEQQILWQYGLVPGTREQYARDDFMANNGLG